MLLYKVLYKAVMRILFSHSSWSVAARVVDFVLYFILVTQRFRLERIKSVLASIVVSSVADEDDPAAATGKAAYSSRSLLLLSCCSRSRLPHGYSSRFWSLSSEEHIHSSCLPFCLGAAAVLQEFSVVVVSGSRRRVAVDSKAVSVSLASEQ